MKGSIWLWTARRHQGSTLNKVLRECDIPVLAAK